MAYYNNCGQPSVSEKSPSLKQDNAIVFQSYYSGVIFNSFGYLLFSNYAGIIFNSFGYLLFPKLCQHNIISRPSGGFKEETERALSFPIVQWWTLCYGFY